MKIVIISKDKIFVQKIKDKFSAFNVPQKILFVVHKKEEDLKIDTLADTDVQCVMIDADCVEDAIAIGEKMNELHPTISVVFLSSNREEAYKYYMVDHMGFIWKNDYEKYLEIIGCRLLKNWHVNDSSFIKVRWKNTVYVIESTDIVYIERDKRKTLVHTIRDEIYTTYQHIDEFAQELKTGFLRIHFSYFVNIAFVKEFHRNHLILKDGTFVPISRKYAKEIKNYYSGADME